MFRIAVSMCLVLSVVCYFLFASLREANEELGATKIALAQAEEAIRIKDASLKISEEVLSQLNEANSILRKERENAEKAIADLFEKMDKPENTAWGNSLIPEDVRNYIIQLNKGEDSTEKKLP